MSNFYNFLVDDHRMVFQNGDCDRFYDKWTRGRPSKTALQRRRMYNICKSKMKLTQHPRVIEIDISRP